jgi:hypothetical protein
MAQKVVNDRVQGKLGMLMDEKYIEYPVQVDILEIAELSRTGGIDAVEVTKSQLVAGHSAPDGRPYTLRYSYKGKNYSLPNLRLEDGILLAG